MNVVIYRVLIERRLQNMLGETSTLDKDGFRRVWVELAAGYGVRPSDVRRVYAQWEPTSDDQAFLAAEFPPKVRVSFSFRRQTNRRDWGNATPEFCFAVEQFEAQLEERERLQSATAVTAARQGRRWPRRPWWQYWYWRGEGLNPFTRKPY